MSATANLVIGIVVVLALIIMAAILANASRRTKSENATPAVPAPAKKTYRERHLGDVAYGPSNSFEATNQKTGKVAPRNDVGVRVLNTAHAASSAEIDNTHER